MDQKKLEEFARQYAQISVWTEQGAQRRPGRYSTNNNTGGMIIDAWLDRPAVCDRCNLVVDSAPVRHYTLKKTGWREYCTGCRETRLDTVQQSEPVIECEPEPSPEPQLEDQLLNITIVPSECGLGQVVERDYPESLIREFVSFQDSPPTLPNADQDFDNAVHKD